MINGKLTIVIENIKEIKTGEELTYSYTGGKKSPGIKDKGFICRCGSHDCDDKEVPYTQENGDCQSTPSEPSDKKPVVIDESRLFNGRVVTSELSQLSEEDVVRRAKGGGFNVVIDDHDDCSVITSDDHDDNDYAYDNDHDDAHQDPSSGTFLYASPDGTYVQDLPPGCDFTNIKEQGYKRKIAFNRDYNRCNVIYNRDSQTYFFRDNPEMEIVAYYPIDPDVHDKLFPKKNNVEDQRSSKRAKFNEQDKYVEDE